ncbi:MAG: T9SS type A sorting domain-containing protein [Bacteroidia bacterium]|nr:T9SS type A sorting domain-containing protein [Bacteroidia bacterium]
MKKILLLCTVLSAASVIRTHSQSIGVGDILSIGETKYTGNDTLPDLSITPGGSGINQTWNYSALVSHHWDTLTAINPSEAPFSSNFPEANIAVENFSEGKIFYYYGKRDVDGLYIYGISGDIIGTGEDICLTFNPGFYMIKCIAMYQTTYNENYYLEITIPAPPNPYNAESVKQRSYTNASTIFDAWGQVTTPEGTYSILRQNTTEYRTDSLWIKIPVIGWSYIQTSQDTSNSYRYWANGIGIPVAELTYDPNADSVKSASYWVLNPDVGVAENNVQLMILYSNPASSQIFLNNLDFNSEYDIQLVDIYGRVVSYIALHNKIAENIDISNLAAGLYIINVSSQSRQILSGKIVIYK